MIEVWPEPTQDDLPDDLPDDLVVLVDGRGRACGSSPKHLVHGRDTPLHLGFSCYLLGDDHRVLITRRAASKLTWPATWTNACCGHPRPGETLRAAVTRRVHDELGVVPDRMAVALPDFAYRAEMDNRIVEHELCPVVVATVDPSVALRLAPDEVEAAEWTTWAALRERAAQAPHTLSPWAVEQVRELDRLGAPCNWLERGDTGRALDEVPGAPAREALTLARHIDPIEPVRAPVERVLDEFMSARAAELTTVDPALAPVTAAICDLVTAGGKRLRPAFVYWGHRAAGGPHEPGVITIAAAVELLHAFALLHDDVMDRSETRRGNIAAHRSLALLHRREHWRGDADWFGTSAAILAGDLTFVWADQLFDCAPLPRASIDRARATFNTLRAEVMAGQYLDLRLAARPAADEADARRVALLKSGRYTVTRPLEMGRRLAADPVSPGVAPALAAYGDAVGIAFQLRDDVLGLFGDPGRTGKDRDGDLREGKRTLLVLRALRLAGPAARRFLEAALGDPALTTGDAERCREIVAACGALASIETLLGAQYEAALAALAPVPEPARLALEELAALAIRREH